MMDALKEALKRHMKTHKSEPDLKDIVMQSHSDKPVDEESDVAPNLHEDESQEDAIGKGLHAHQAIKPGVQPTADGGEQELHQKIMQALMGHNSPMGRTPNTLNEKASDKYKEKMASIMKHKKSV